MKSNSQSFLQSLILGPTNVGKSTFVFELLKHANGAFAQPPQAIFYCYSIDQDLFAEMKMSIPNITFHEGLPTRTQLEAWHMEEPREKVLVIDDLMIESAQSKSVVDIYCKYAHHMKYWCLITCQNAFCPGREWRTISLQTQYFFLFKNERNKLQVQILGRQIFPDQSRYFADAYSKATKEKYSYLLIDINPHSDPKYKLRTNILPGQTMTVYLPDNTA